MRGLGHPWNPRTRALGRCSTTQIDRELVACRQVLQSERQVVAQFRRRASVTNGAIVPAQFELGGAARGAIDHTQQNGVARRCGGGCRFPKTEDSALPPPPPPALPSPPPDPPHP